MKDRPDFVQVTLSPAGVAFAGDGGTVTVSTARMSYTFSAKPVEVLTSEWRQIRADADAQGQALFQQSQQDAQQEFTQQTQIPPPAPSSVAEGETK